MICGTKVSTYNSQIQTSTGFSSLDEFIGGGISNNTISLFPCTPTNTYAEVLLRGYLSQGLVNSTHDLCILSLDKPVGDILKNLYDPVTSSVDRVSGSAGPPTRRASPLAARDDKMKIAWRYQSLPKLAEEDENDNGNGGNAGVLPLRRGITFTQRRLGGLSISPQQQQQQIVNEPYCAQFDITKLLSSEVIEQKKDRVFPVESVEDIVNLLDNYTPENGRYLRICILNAGYPVYDFTALMKLLRLLKCAMIGKMAACMVSLPMAAFSDAQLKSLSHLGDYVIQMKTFASTDKSYFAKEYTGLMEVVKLPRINRLLPPRSTINAQPVGVDKRFGFKCKRTKFLIEILCLPPELQETPSRTTSNVPSTGGCSSSTLSF